MDVSKELEVARVAARAGGLVALEHLGNPLYFSWKAHRDILVGASIEVQNAIFEVIRAAFPEDGLLGEEGDDDEPLPIYADRLWVVDPVDGSINYFQGIPFYAISIALRWGGKYVVGVVYDPSRDEMFAATAESGATLNGQTIFVEQVSEGHDAYERAIVGTDLPGSVERRGEALMLVSMLASEVVTVVTLGSPALGLCYVAAGRLHAYCHLDLKLWDVAAAALIVDAAGGVVTDARGGAWQHSDGGYVATNRLIHGTVLRNILPILQLREPMVVDATARGPAVFQGE